MASALAWDDLARSASMASSRRSWRSASIREVWNAPDVFQRSGRQEADDEEELKWAAIERLPTYDRMRKGMLKQVLSNGRIVQNEVDVSHLGAQDKRQLMESILKVVEDDNERFLTRLRDRTDRSASSFSFSPLSNASLAIEEKHGGKNFQSNEKHFVFQKVCSMIYLSVWRLCLIVEFYGYRVGIEIPKIEVRFQNFSIEGDGYVGTRALPTLLNSTLNAVEVSSFFCFFICFPFLLIRVEIFFRVEKKV